MNSHKSALSRTLLLCVCTVSTALLLNVQTAVAFSISDYFTLSYQIILSTSEVNEGQTFNVVASGSGTLKAALPISVSSAIIEGRIVATNQATGTKVTLNSGYTLTIAPFPNEVGQTTRLTQTIPLNFPAGSPAGNYTVVGELIDAKVDAIIWIDVSDYLSSSQTIGTVNYVSASSGSTGNGNSGGSSLTITTTVTVTVTASQPQQTSTTTGPIITTSQPSQIITTTPSVITTTQPPQTTTTTAPPLITSAPSGLTSVATAPLKSKPVSNKFNWWWLVSFTVIALGGIVMFLIVKRAGRPLPFSVSNLVIMPSVIKPGNTATVTVNVTNMGNRQGMYKVILKINNLVESSCDVTLIGGDSKTVYFTVVRKKPGIYNININNVNGRLLVQNL